MQRTGGGGDREGEGREGKGREARKGKRVKIEKKRGGGGRKGAVGEQTSVSKRLHLSAGGSAGNHWLLGNKTD